MAQMASGRRLLRPFGGSFLMILGVFLYVVLAFSLCVFIYFFSDQLGLVGRRLGKKIGKDLGKD